MSDGLGSSSSNARRADFRVRAWALALLVPFFVPLVVLFRGEGPRPFVRLKDGFLETARATYLEKRGGAAVTLVGVIHVGDREYFEDVQRTLDSADRVLVEGVAGLGSRTRAMGTYAAIASACGLVLQTQILEVRPSFVNADLTWDEWAKAVGPEAVRRTRAQLDAADRVESLSDGERRKLRTTIGRRLLVPSSPVLIAARNERCFEVLETELRGRRAGTVVILYGASHMPDLHERLLARGFQLERLEWRRVFSLEQ